MLDPAVGGNLSLPKGWPARVRAATVHAISLAPFSLHFARDVAAEVVVDAPVPHPRHFLPRNLRVGSTSLGGDAPRCLADDLDVPENASWVRESTRNASFPARGSAAVAERREENGSGGLPGSAVLRRCYDSSPFPPAVGRWRPS